MRALQELLRTNAQELERYKQIAESSTAAVSPDPDPSAVQGKISSNKTEATIVIVWSEEVTIKRQETQDLMEELAQLAADDPRRDSLERQLERCQGELANLEARAEEASDAAIASARARDRADRENREKLEKLEEALRLKSEAFVQLQQEVRFVFWTDVF